jgi:adenylate/nucleoside-diphosphate kinase
MLVIGRAMTGKTCFCRDLARRLGLVHVECQRVVEKLF